MPEYDDVLLKTNPSGLPALGWEVSDGAASLHLQNIIDDFVLPSVISSEEKDDLVEVAAILINEYVSEDPTIFMDPSFHENAIQNVIKLIEIQLENVFAYDISEEIEDAVNEASALFYIHM
jgi:hypothetical protein